MEVKHGCRKMNPLRWRRAHRIAFFGAAVLGACMGFVVGVRRVDPSVNQDFYWLWLGLWMVSGAVMGVLGGYIRQLLRRPLNASLGLIRAGTAHAAESSNFE